MATDGPPIAGIPNGAGNAAGAGEAATGAGGAVARIAPARRTVFGDLARQNAQLRDDVVLGGRDGEERPAVLPVSRSVTVVSTLYPLPSLETVP